jgi:hypothetical protein
LTGGGGNGDGQGGGYIGQSEGGRTGKSDFADAVRHEIRNIGSKPSNRSLVSSREF